MTDMVSNRRNAELPRWSLWFAERLVSHSNKNKLNVFFGTNHANLNQDRAILFLPKKCRPETLISGNIKSTPGQTV